ncbi:MAG TPA: PRC-barrel domain-containing protein [Tepidisphaeraceae bacterium]|nr:PRC-barrel domain-containing protein [Tepidisphaeraceae bacterium]
MQERSTHNIVKLSDTAMELSTPAEDIRGRKVVDANGEELGEVDDLMIDDVEKKVRFIRVATGGFLGLGATKFLIPVDAIARVSGDTVHVNRNREHVAAGPVYDPDLVKPDYYERVYGHYGVAPFWAGGYTYPAYPFF